MNPVFIEPENFQSLVFENIPVIDVRSELEFTEGHLANSFNFPILCDAERVQVGTAYKKEGRQRALDLGHSLVSGDTRGQRLKNWTCFIEKNPKAVLTCWRGGLRSQIAQDWCREAGFEVPRLRLGYKEFRRFLTETSAQVVHRSEFFVVGGLTGSRKTGLLRGLKLGQGRSLIDLEALANHKGSAFGQLECDQPSQASFENSLFSEFIKTKIKIKTKTLGDVLPGDANKLVLEDESRMIGKNCLPENVFLKLRQSELIFIEADLDLRVENIFKEYIQETGLDLAGIGNEAIFNYFCSATKMISKKLGSERAGQILKLLNQANLEVLQGGSADPHREWIRILLKDYYDPLYLSSVKKRDPKYRFRGSPKDVEDFLLKI